MNLSLFRLGVESMEMSMLTVCAVAYWWSVHELPPVSWDIFQWIASRLSPWRDHPRTQGNMHFFFCETNTPPSSTTGAFQGDMHVKVVRGRTGGGAAMGGGVEEREKQKKN
jgi:hypothetical protein